MRTDFFFPADSLLPGVSPAQQHRCLEEENCNMSSPIFEMVNFDPLASLTVCQGNLYPDDLPATISDLVDKEINDVNETNLAPYIRNEKGIEYIPADLSLSLKEIQLVVVPRREYVLKEILERVADRYEYILIDCPPPCKS